MLAFNAIFPVFALILFGAFIAKKKLLSAKSFAQLTDLLYWWAIPVWLFIKFASLKDLSLDITNYFSVFLLATFSSVVLGYVIAWILRLPKVKVGAFVQLSFRGNLVFVGLPIAVSYITQLGLKEHEGLMLLALPPMIIVYNLLAVLLLVVHGVRVKGKSRLDQVRLGVVTTLTNPLILSCALGLLFRAGSWTMPIAIAQTFSVLGGMVVPLSLIVVGGSVEFKGGGKHSEASFIGGLIKTFATPWAAYFAAQWIGLELEKTVILMFFLASPTAASAYILAKQLGSDATMTANATLLGTIFSFFSALLIFSSF